jgi:hypothetical protein
MDNMNQRLIWNFEFSSKKVLSLIDLKNTPDTEPKWEARFFWPENQIISLNLIDPALLDISHYEQKHKEDFYYILPDHDYNLKRRRNELLYKPVLKKTPLAIGFGPKIKLEEIQNDSDNNHLMSIKLLAQEHGTLVQVKKVSFVYKFPTNPKIKLELARIEVHGKTYFSACVEGRSLFLVETISEHLLGKQVSCDYVSFLKSVSDND